MVNRKSSTKKQSQQVLYSLNKKSRKKVSLIKKSRKSSNKVSLIKKSRNKVSLNKKSSNKVSLNKKSRKSSNKSKFRVTTTTNKHKKNVASRVSEAITKLRPESAISRKLRINKQSQVNRVFKKSSESSNDDSPKIRTPISRTITTKDKLLSKRYIHEFRHDYSVDLDFMSKAQFMAYNYLTLVHPNKITIHDKQIIYSYNYIYPENILSNYKEVLNELMDKTDFSTRYYVVSIVKSKFKDSYATRKLAKILYNEKNINLTKKFDMKYYYNNLYKYKILTVIALFNLEKEFKEFEKAFDINVKDPQSMHGFYTYFYNTYKDYFENKYDVVDINLSLDEKHIFKTVDQYFKYILDNRLISSHTTALLFDLVSNTVEYYDPHGCPNMTEDEDILNNKFEKFFSTKSDIITFLPLPYICPRESVQTIQSKVKVTHKLPDVYEDIGYCMIWTLWYIDMRIINENISQQELVNKIHDLHYKHPKLSLTIVRHYWECLEKYLQKVYFMSEGLPITEQDIFKEIDDCRTIKKYNKINIKMLDEVDTPESDEGFSVYM